MESQKEKWDWSRKIIWRYDHWKIYKFEEILQTHGGQQTPSTIDKREIILVHQVKLLKIKDKESILKAARLGEEGEYTLFYI